MPSICLSCCCVTVLSHWKENWNSCLLEIYVPHLLDLPKSTALNWKRLNKWPGKICYLNLHQNNFSNLIIFICRNYSERINDERTSLGCRPGINDQCSTWILGFWYGNYAGTSKSGIVLHWSKILQSKFEDIEVKYKGKLDQDRLTKWILDYYQDLPSHNMDNMREFKEPSAQDKPKFNMDYKPTVGGGY